MDGEHFKGFIKENDMNKERSREYYLNLKKLIDSAEQYYKYNPRKLTGLNKDNLEKAKEQYFRRYYEQWYKDHCKKLKLLREENPEKHAEYSKQYYKKNREKILEKKKQYLKDNPGKAKEMQIKSKQWREDNPEKVKKQYRKYNIKNAGKINKNRRINQAKRWKTDLKFNLNYKMGKNIGEALKSNKAGQKWEDLTGYTLTDLIKRLNKTMPGGYTWKDYLSGALHIDHILPKRLFQYTIPEDKEFKQCWNLYNLRLLPAKENLLKNDNITNPILLGLLLKQEKPLQPVLAM